MGQQTQTPGVCIHKDILIIFIFLNNTVCISQMTCTTITCATYCTAFKNDYHLFKWSTLHFKLLW